jgi:predicted DNA-binding transcriptional regulator AlpA
MFIERRLKGDPDFPRPIKIGNLRFWNLRSVQAYEQLCAARSPSSRAA